MSVNNPAIVWFRQDLRIADQPALAAGLKHKNLIPVYIWEPSEEGDWPPGAASKWWLHDSLASLDASLAKLGSKLILRRGPTLQALKDVITASGATSIYWNRRYEPAAAQRDKLIQTALESAGIKVETFNGSLLQDPAATLNQSGSPYLVFGAFWRVQSVKPVGALIDAPSRLPPLPAALSSATLESFSLKPAIPWDGGLQKTWQIGERPANAALARFCSNSISGYQESRDLPAESGTSRLSPHLHFGELSPRQVWALARNHENAGALTFMKEIMWREFSYYLLHHHPRLANEPLQAKFKDFHWESDPVHLEAWKRGLTGFPIVDAGMRELWHTGWMHNRVRMIVASFLVKDLRIHWLEGARWFWDTLVDADLASNSQGWQWTSGCGADAAPYFRVFNPTLQEKKFDPDQAYVRRWIPEFGTPSYPAPIVDHGRARFAALRAFDAISSTSRK